MTEQELIEEAGILTGALLEASLPEDLLHEELLLLARERGICTAGLERYTPGRFRRLVERIDKDARWYGLRFEVDCMPFEEPVPHWGYWQDTEGDG